VPRRPGRQRRILMNMERRVDPRVQSVSVAGLRAYLEARGWSMKPFPRPHVLLFEGPSDDDGQPLQEWVPVSEQLHDYRDAVVKIITNLSVIEDRHPVDVLEDILGQTRAEPSAPGKG